MTPSTLSVGSLITKTFNKGKYGPRDSSAFFNGKKMLVMSLVVVVIHLRLGDDIGV